MAIPASDPWYRAEKVPPNLEAFAYALAAAYGAPRSAVGLRGNPATHFRGSHRSRAFIKNSPHCTNRTYTVSRTPGDRTGGDSNWTTGVDLTLPEDKLILLCRRLDAAVRSGRHEEVTEWFGNDDGDNRVDGFDNIADRLATSDNSHLWHVHMTFDRGQANNDHTGLLAELTGDDMYEAEDRQRDINTNGRTAVVYPIAAGIARLEAVAGVLVKLAGEDAERDAAEAKLDAERHAEEMQLDAERHVEVVAKLAAVQAGDPVVLAELLGEYLTEDFLDALAQIRLTRAGT